MIFFDDDTSSLDLSLELDSDLKGLDYGTDDGLGDRGHDSTGVVRGSARSSEGFSPDSWNDEGGWGFEDDLSDSQDDVIEQHVSDRYTAYDNDRVDDDPNGFSWDYVQEDDDVEDGFTVDDGFTSEIDSVSGYDSFDDDTDDTFQDDEYVDPAELEFYSQDNGKNSVKDQEQEDKGSVAQDSDTDAKDTGRKPKKSRGKSGNDKKSGLSSRLNAIKEQILADARGEKIPDAAPESDDDILTESPGDRESEGKRRGKPAKGKSPVTVLLAPFKTLWRLYMKVVGIFFKLVEKILKALSRIPLVGRVFKILLSFTRVLKIVLTSLPLILVVVFGWMYMSHGVPGETTASLPDNGSVQFTDFSYSDGKVSGTVKNTGDIVAEVQPVFKVYTIQPGLSPLTWLKYREQVSCSGSVVEVDIDSSAQVSAECGPVDGFMPKVSGSVE